MTDQPTDTEQAPPGVYTKANSFQALAGAEDMTASVHARVQAFRDKWTADGVDPHRAAILQRAFADLDTPDAGDGEHFELLPHVVAEIAALDDANLERYLFYRYRYDVFPATKELDDYPPCVQIEPTSICNYRCVFCYQTDKNLTQGRHGHMGMMSVDTFKAIVDQLEGHVEAVTLASRGEPLMCKGIEEMLGYLPGKFLGLKINTNASFLTESKCHAILEAEPSALVFSADAADDELYAKLRVNGKLDKVVKNVEMFNDIRAKHYSRSRTITRVSGVSYTDDQKFDDIGGFWGNLADQVAFVAYNPWENAYEQPPNGLSTPCSDLWRRAFVWWDGKVNPCDVDYLSSLSVGTVMDTSITDLWRGEGYERLREMHLGDRRRDLMPCKGCVVV